MVKIKPKPKRKGKLPANKETEQGLNKRDSSRYDIQKEIEDDYYKLFQKFDKIFKKEFGEMCPKV